MTIKETFFPNISIELKDLPIFIVPEFKDCVPSSEYKVLVRKFYAGVLLKLLSN